MTKPNNIPPKGSYIGPDTVVQGKDGMPVNDTVNLEADYAAYNGWREKFRKDLGKVAENDS